MGPAQSATAWVTDASPSECLASVRSQLEVALPPVVDLTSPFQRVAIHDTTSPGERALFLDGVLQLLTRDEAAYHEMLVHVPVVAWLLARASTAAAPTMRVLLVGAGDGGALRELLRHACVAEVVHVEIDAEVVRACREFLPGVSAGAFDDARVDLRIMDGLEFLRHDRSLFDVILVDSSDPTQGPNGSLFGDDFYTLLKARLEPTRGILCFQAENQWLHPSLVRGLHRRASSLFPTVAYYVTQVPSYPGGQIGFFLCSVDASLNPQTVVAQVHPGNSHVLDESTKQMLDTLQYYNFDMHHASFALPNATRQRLMGTVEIHCNSSS